MNDLQKKQLEILKEFIRVCEKHNLRYFLVGGTCLGAARHHGFIPWDDDMDLFLTRENYQKLLKVAPQEFKEPYFFQNALTDKKFFIGYSRLRNSETTGILKWEESLDYNNGVYIDIFVFDAFIDDKTLVAKQRRRAKFYGKLAEHYYATGEKRNWWQRLTLSVFQHTFCKVVPYETLIRLYEKELRRYEGKTDKYAMLTHDDSFLNYCDKEIIQDTIYVDYEMIKVPVPKEYDRFLTNQYGDYMQFPPVEERGMWHGDNIIYDPDVSYKEYIKNHG